MVIQSYKSRFMILWLILFTPFVQASEGGTLFKSICMSCHTATAHLLLAAPPVFRMKHHVLQSYPRRDDFINHIVQWVQKPSASRALMPGAVKKFGLMPALPYAEEQLRQIAEFLYDTDMTEPGWELESPESDQAE